MSLLHCGIALGTTGLLMAAAPALLAAPVLGALGFGAAGVGAGEFAIELVDQPKSC